jgi:hypothetical protein
VSRVVFLVEEPSMKYFLDELLPREFPELEFICLPHEGKRDLELSLPRKLRAWREPGVRFVVLRDNDGGDCRVIKQRLVELCREAGRDDALVRIVCQELEAWYVGDPMALAAAFADPTLAELAAKARFRDPDAVDQPSVALAKLIPSFQKLSGARAMGSTIDAARNSSRSFQVFLTGLRRIAPDATEEN